MEIVQFGKRCETCHRQLPRTASRATCSPACSGPPLKGPDYEMEEWHERKARENNVVR